ncbi:hypothetical protein Tco_0389771 [Tanacetum coccineum]
MMEILNLMLRRRVMELGLFTYHRYCSKLELINLCFGDDLFLFGYGDIQSATVIMEALEEFKFASGLTSSLPKSTTYFCNVLNHIKISILYILPFEEGHLPIKYFGVPLVSSRLMVRDCKELIEKVMRGFLWYQGEMKKGKAKVAWEVVCLPKDEGGLNLSSKVKDIVQDGAWVWPPNLLAKNTFLSSCSVPVVEGSLDKLKW